MDKNFNVSSYNWFFFFLIAAKLLRCKRNKTLWPAVDYFPITTCLVGLWTPWIAYWAVISHNIKYHIVNPFTRTPAVTRCKYSFSYMFCSHSVLQFCYFKPLSYSTASRGPFFNPLPGTPKRQFRSLKSLFQEISHLVQTLMLTHHYAARCEI